MTAPAHREDPADLAARFCAGSMTDAEERDFAAHLASGCLVCQEQVADYMTVAEGLVECVAPLEPPAIVRSRLMAQVTVACALEQFDSGSRTPAGDEPRIDLSPVDRPVGMFVRRQGERPWTDTPHRGVQLRILHVDHARKQFTALVRMAPGATYPPHSHDAPEECLVLEGDLRFADQVLRAGDFLRTEAGFQQAEQTTEVGCLLYLTSPLD